MNKRRFFYMSGTGNTYQTAVWAAEKLKKKGKTILMPFEKADITSYRPDDTPLTGIFFPTHGFTLPLAALMFVLKMPRARKSPVFVIATRAGGFYGPWPLPGMEGTACLIAALILFLKGYDVVGFSGMDMPSNWLDIHWGMNKEHAEYFYAKTRKETGVFMQKISSGARVYKSIPSWIMGLLLLQVSLMYIIFARLMLAKIKFADERCNSCAICAKYCPFDAILMLGKKGKEKPYWTFNCESCERCIGYCPKQAIQAGHSYLFLLYWLMYGALGFIPLYVMGKFAILGSGLPATLFSVTYSLVFYFIGQWLLHFITRTGFGARLFSFTTLTKIFRRYHQVEAGLKGMKDGLEI